MEKNTRDILERLKLFINDVRVKSEKIILGS